VSNDIFVILGAAVWPGGVPSNAMRRRVRGAVFSAQSSLQPIFLVTGAVGRNPPSEAKVMQQILIESGIAPEKILLDEASHDTLASVINCSRIIQAIPDVGSVTVCSDLYHIPRTRWLFYLKGIHTKAGMVEDGRHQTKLMKWLYYCLREIPATVQDTFLSIISRGTVEASI
jgi:vancomycin permeability regulator SanA